MKPWEMILAHTYAEAAACYDAQLKNSPDDPDLLSAHAIAMLGLGRLVEALDELRRANALASRRLKGETQPYLEKIGSILWLLGKRGEAIHTFRGAVDGIVDGSIKYADNAGGVSQGVLLWYASVTTGDEAAKNHALKYLRRLAKKSRIKQWPGALAVFALGEKTHEEVLMELCGTTELDESMKRAKNDLLTRRRLVQALFYFATRKREERDEQQCRAGMEKCASLENPILENEWYLARAEVEQA